MSNFNKLWEQLNNIEKAEFIDKPDYEEFQYYINNPSSILMEMANVRGNDIEVEDKLPFSFYFSSKSKVHNRHAIRVKILWNPSKTSSDADGYMELHGEYKYVSGSHKYKPTNKELEIARNFFKTYKVLFVAVWEEKLDDVDLQDYLRGNNEFKNILNKFYNISEKEFYKINHCKNIFELEDCVRKSNIFNMND